MGSDPAKVGNTTWGKNGEGWFWIFAGFTFVLLFLFFLDPKIFEILRLYVMPFVVGVLASASGMFRSLKKEIAELKQEITDLKSGVTEDSPATQDSE